MYKFIYFIAAGIAGLLFFIFQLSLVEIYSNFLFPKMGTQSVTMMLCDIKQQTMKNEKKV